MFKFLSQRKILIALMVVSLISYGQMLGMNFWQDDNALVFKFTHINEDAGYLGKGLFGEGAYRYTITPYLPVFYVFGYNPLPYFAYTLTFFILSVFVIYFFFQIILEDKKKAGIAGLLYAMGYVASDGFIRVFNSVLTSLSVIFVCGTLGFYYKYFKTNRLRWYVISLFFYLLAIEIGYIRTHFLIFVVIALEFIFFFSRSFNSSKNIFKGFLVSSLRILPFLLLFYKWFIAEADPRSGQVGSLVKSILAGEVYKTYSFFASLGNILLSNEFFPAFISSVQNKLNLPLTENKVIFILVLIFGCLSLFLILQRVLSFKLGVVFIVLVGIMVLKAKEIFSYPGLIGGLNEKISLYSGIILLFVFLLLWKILPFKKISFLFFVWLVVNLAAYAAYIPIYAYPSDNRYLLESFIPMVGLLSLWSFDLYKKISHSHFAILPIVLVAIWGGINLFSAVSWQRKILDHRSQPSKRFFTQLKEYVPKFEKGSLFYFFVPDKPFARVHYDNGFSVAQMPEETAIAWRYGLDRYDFKIVDSYDELSKSIKEGNIPIEKVYAFVADPDKLINMTSKVRRLLKEGAKSESVLNLTSSTELEKTGKETSVKMLPLMFYPKDVTTIIPLKLLLFITGDHLNLEEGNFPLKVQGQNGSITQRNIREHYLEFRQKREILAKTVSVSATTSWKKYEANLLIDGDPETYWEADRVVWDDHNQGFTLDLGKEIKLGGIFLRNGPSSLTPTEFEVFTSSDGQKFHLVRKVHPDTVKRDEVQKILFDETLTRYLKISFHKTLYDDAPGISEIEVIPAEFTDIDYNLAERFFKMPFSEVNSSNEWTELIDAFKEKGLLEVSWKTDASDKIFSTVTSILPIKYDSGEQTVRIEIPAAGEKLEFIKITPLTIPGTIVVSKVRYENLPIGN